MGSYLSNLMQQIEALNASQILAQILIAIVLGFVIYLSYYLAHAGTVYSRKFNVSLVVLTVLTTVVMTAIGNNVALSLGMVGALSIVRFRTAIKDSRDTVYIFWAIVAGLSCGVGDYMTAGLGSAGVFLVLLVLGRIKNENRMLLIVRGARSTEERIMSVITHYFDGRLDLRVKNTTRDTIELIYEIPRKTYEKNLKKTSSIDEELYQIEHIQYVNIVAQDDDISS
ncbi:DUF4956 domain-containing protein [Holdemania filiformis]|uniref:DUF4956 domain-containing protein n=1 Tax=Holdemania filiformis TaxID=61171 RepID=A0A412FFS7_9FIRM|nr:DUF4956 domain-containing protein [Holdemania filiformis]MBS5000860.1 DUF4956 domain-containing protein [Holdemania filiformis]RGR66959.1 DUF4956 domain-containing protein [Holdemania filiformis]